MLDTLRQEGLARCSRPFALPGGGARIVTLQLGPGYLRGDRFACAGSVGARAELAVTAQAATRALGRGAESVATAHWNVATGGTLRLLGEPLVLYAGARHRATTDIVLAADATFVFLDVIAPSATFERLSTRLHVRGDAGLLLYDALVLTPRHVRGAIGSAFFVRAAREAHDDEALLAAADAAARAATQRYGVRIGVGSPACRGLALRALGPCAADVRAALADVLAGSGALAPRDAER